MTDRTDPLAIQREASGERLPWVAPRVQTIRTGEAEYKTRQTVADGAYTFS